MLSLTYCKLGSYFDIVMCNKVETVRRSDKPDLFLVTVSAIQATIDLCASSGLSCKPLHKSQFHWNVSYWLRVNTNAHGSTSYDLELNLQTI